jgi:hypothetical protein
MRAVIGIATAALLLACGGNTNSDPSGGPTGGGGGSDAGVSGSGGVPSTGGSPGTGGASVGGGSAGTGIGPECTDSSQCKLFEDCCSCEAYAQGEDPPPSCFAACKQTKCSELGLAPDDVACVAGRCVPLIDCSSPVFCNALPPDCNVGEVPSVVGGCWGACVPATECPSVPSCEACTGPLTTCVTIDFSGGDGVTRHCVSIPKGCEGTPTCACMGQNVCIAPTSECTDLSGLPGMVCGCAAC